MRSRGAQLKLVRSWASQNQLALVLGVCTGILANFVGLVVFGPTGWVSSPTLPTGVLGLALGIIVGRMQWQILRRYFPDFGWWLVVTTLGILTGVVMLFFPWLDHVSQVEHFNKAFTPTILFATGGGLWLGLWQALVLKRYLTHWRWWLVASGTGALLAAESIFLIMWILWWLVVHGMEVSFLILWFLIPALGGGILLILFLPGYLYGWVTALVFVLEPPPTIVLKK